MARKPSLREIARLCNLSPTTVSRVVNNVGSYSETTRRLVLDTMRREGYFEDGAQSTDAMPLVGVLLNDFTNELFTARLAAIETFFAARGYLVLACETRTYTGRETELLQQLYQMDARGAIVTATRYDGEEELTMPLVHLDSSVTTLADSTRYVVASDDYVGGQMAAQELLQKGCQNPIVLNLRYGSSATSLRVNGFCDMFTAHGIQITLDRVMQPEIHRSGFEAAKDIVVYLWMKGVQFDSVFACSDWRAYGALVALRSLGVHVPEQVKIVGYDGSQIARYNEQPITTIVQDTAAIAQQACNMLWTLMQGESIAQRQVMVPIQLRKGKTT